MTLSHRWGDGSILQLTADKLHAMEQDIPMAALSRTFRDAVGVAIALNVFYIWIDSICIIQDSEDDWEFEAGFMKNAYQHSICTLAATNSGGGLYVERNPEDLYPSQVNVDWATPQHCSIIDTNVWDREVSDAALCRRAWVVQERLLSQRVLHFGIEQLLWECREIDACETFPDGFPEFPETDTPTAAFKDLENVRGHHKSESASSSKYLVWNRIVESYSGCMLTKASDKLVALSGVAAYFKDMLQDDYVAGLWKATLPRALLWLVNDMGPTNGIPRVRPLEYRAPSWSWAAMDGSLHCKMTQMDGDLVATLIDATVGLRSANATGGVVSGHVSIKGRILTATWRKEGVQPWPKVVVAHRSQILEGVNFAFPDVGSDVNSLDMYILPILSTKLDVEPGRSNESYLFRGIVLRQIAPPSGMNISAPCFRRVGACFFSSRCSIEGLDDIQDTVVYIF